jgi:hypothetical protein
MRAGEVSEVLQDRCDRQAGVFRRRLKNRVELLIGILLNGQG